jgi:hypothetical protein
MKFIRVCEADIEEKERSKKRNVSLFIDSFISSGLELAEAIDDTECFNNNNDFCRSLNHVIKGSNYKFYVMAFMKYGRVYLRRVDI